MKPFRAFLSVLVLLACSAAHAGVVMSFETRNQGSKEPTSKGTVWIEGSDLRVESDGTLVIFRGEPQVLQVLEPGSKECVEMTKSDAERAGNMMKELDAQLAALPPEQRAMVEQMMKSQMKGMDMPKADSAPLEFVRTGKTETISGFATTSYDMKRGAKVEGEAWIAAWPVADITEKDFAGLTRLADFVKSLAGPFAKMFEDPFVQRYEGPGSVPGLPIRTVAAGSIHEVTKLARETVPASRFQMPEGLKKTTMQEQMGH